MLVAVVLKFHVHDHVPMFGATDTHTHAHIQEENNIDHGMNQQQRHLPHHHRHHHCCRQSRSHHSKGTSAKCCLLLSSPSLLLLFDVLAL